MFAEPVCNTFLRDFLYNYKTAVLSRESTFLRLLNRFNSTKHLQHLDSHISN